MLPDLIGLTFLSNRSPSEGRAGRQLSMGCLPGEGVSPSLLGGLGLVCKVEHNNLFVIIHDGEVGDLLTEMGCRQDVI